MIALLLLALQVVAAPWPDTLSHAARDGLAADAAGPSMAARRDRADAIQRAIGERQLVRYGVTMADRVIAGVPVRVFTPRGGARGSAILLNLHGGGFVVDSGSITENVPIAALTRHVVIAVRYRLAPEHRYPAALDDAVAVYRALQIENAGRRIALFGTSAGAILAAELVARLRADHVAPPVALGFFSGTGDLTAGGDSATLFQDAGSMRAVAMLYAGARDPADPALSPARGKVDGWPPTLCVSSTRDFLLSATADVCRRLDAAGSDARLVVFDGLPHAFWSYIEAPESDAAFEMMARFLRKHLETTP